MPHRPPPRTGYRNAQTRRPLFISTLRILQHCGRSCLWCSVSTNAIHCLSGRFARQGFQGRRLFPFLARTGKMGIWNVGHKVQIGGRLSRKKVKKRMRKLNEGQTNIKITQIAAAQHELNPQGMPDSHRLLFYIEPITERQTRVGQSPANITTRLFSYRSDAPSMGGTLPPHAGTQFASAMPGRSRRLQEPTKMAWPRPMAALDCCVLAQRGR